MFSQKYLVLTALSVVAPCGSCLSQYTINTSLSFSRSPDAISIYDINFDVASLLTNINLFYTTSFSVI